MRQGTMGFDVIVIGLGLSGLMAAKTAVEAGKKVLLIGKGTGSLCILSHSIDVLGKTNGETVEGAVRRLSEGNPKHPYALVGWEAIEAALGSFCSLFPPPDDFVVQGGRNSLLITGAGTRRPTYLVPKTMAGGIFAEGERTLIVGFEGFNDFHAEYIAHHLKARGITIPLPQVSDKSLKATGIARLMERSDFIQEIARTINKRLTSEEYIGLPALLGLANPGEVMENLKRHTGRQVFEIPLLPPSLPGIRVFNRFKAYLISRGVQILQGQAVISARREGTKVTGIVVSHPPLKRTYTARAFILATGRFLGGGLVGEEESIVEPIFHLPLHQPPRRGMWFNKNFFSPRAHPLHEAGVMVNEMLQPVDGLGERVMDNLWAAGSILSHHHSIEELSREGIDLATGYVAARRACDL